MMDGGIVKARKDAPFIVIKSEEKDVSVKSITKVKTSSSSSIALAAPFVKDKLVPKSKDSEAVPAGPKVPRGVLPAKSAVVGVCFMESPKRFYVCPSSCLDKFMEILSSAQEAPPGNINPVLGTTCLAVDEECWYRGEVVKLSTDMAEANVFLLDYGKTVALPVSSLR